MMYSVMRLCLSRSKGSEELPGKKSEREGKSYVIGRDIAEIESTTQTAKGIRRFGRRDTINCLFVFSCLGTYDKRRPSTRECRLPRSREIFSKVALASLYGFATRSCKIMMNQSEYCVIMDIMVSPEDDPHYHNAINRQNASEIRRIQRSSGRLNAIVREGMREAKLDVGFEPP